MTREEEGVASLTAAKRFMSVNIALLASMNVFNCYIMRKVVITGTCTTYGKWLLHACLGHRGK